MRTKTIAGVALAAIVTASAPGHAQPAMNRLEVAIKPLFDDPKLVKRLPEGVKFYFGPQAVDVAQDLGPTNSYRMTVRGARTKADACRWALLSSLKAMGEQAQKAGGNAVVGLYSVIGEDHRSEATFICVFSENTLSVSLRGTMAVVK